MLARQLRLRLEAVDSSDVPRSLQNIVVSIHAIATFQALHDYLRPRVAGLLGSGSRLSGMLAALAASGFGGANTRALAEELSQASQPTAPPTEDNRTTISGNTVTRRRSQRLSAKQSAVIDSAAAGSSSAQTETASAQFPDVGNTMDTAMDTDLAADFTDDELDADAFDDDMDTDNSVTEKTINLSVAEGPSILKHWS